MSLEQALLLLLFAYITAFLLLGLAKGRQYFRSYVSEHASGSYLFHDIRVTLTLAGLAMTALALFLGFGFENLERVSSIILFFSISFVVLTLSSNFARFPKRAYKFVGDVLADVGVLAIGCGFLVFSYHELPLSHGLMFVYGLFIAFFLLLSSLDFYKYYKYWSLFNDEKEKAKNMSASNSNSKKMHARTSELIMRKPEELSMLTGLLDFFSDRATTHASFVVAGTFGFYAILFAYAQFSLCPASRLVFLFACFALIAINIYSFLNFGYYATLADIVKVELEGQHYKEFEDYLDSKLRERKNPFVTIFWRSRVFMGRGRYGIFIMTFVLAILSPFFWIFFFS